MCEVCALSQVKALVTFRLVAVGYDSPFMRMTKPARVEVPVFL